MSDAPGPTRREALQAGLGLVAGATLAGCGADASVLEPPKPDSRPPFFGLVAEGTLPLPDTEQQRVLAGVAGTGARTLRQTFRWADIEIRRGVYDFAAHDRLVLAAARAELQVLPILFEAPGFETPGGKRRPGEPSEPPRDMGRFAEFARRAAARYGPGGDLWTEAVRLQAQPITAWQVWNEPNLPVYWGGAPDAKEYAAMLDAVAPALREVDPKAEVVTGGIPNSKLGIPFRRYLRDLLAEGVAERVDTVAVHPYAKTDAGTVQAVETARAALDDVGGTETAIRVTEFGWSSDGPGSAFTVGPESQALFLGRALRRLAARRRELKLRGVVYYGWTDLPTYEGVDDFWGLHTGLVRQDGTPKPALAAFSAAVRQARVDGVR